MTLKEGSGLLIMVFCLLLSVSGTKKGDVRAERTGRLTLLRQRPTLSFNEFVSSCKRNELIEFTLGCVFNVKFPVEG